MRTKLTPERAAALRAVPLFKGCDEKELARIDSLVDEIEVPAGETLTREGKVGQQSFVILAGEASVVLRDRSLARLHDGEFFGEMAVLAAGRPCSATVTAITPMRLLVLDPRSFTAVLEIPSVARKVIVGLVERLRDAEGAPSYA